MKIYKESIFYTKNWNTPRKVARSVRIFIGIFLGTKVQDLKVLRNQIANFGYLRVRMI